MRGMFIQSRGAKSGLRQGQVPGGLLHPDGFSTIGFVFQDEVA